MRYAREDSSQNKAGAEPLAMIQFILTSTVPSASLSWANSLSSSGLSTIIMAGPTTCTESGKKWRCCLVSPVALA